MADFKRKTLFQLTWPLFIHGILVTGSTILDGIIVSQYSPEMRAAVAVANQVLAVAWDLSVLFSVGTLVLVAQYLGKNDTQRAEQAATIGIAANAAFSFVISLGIVLLGPWLVRAVETPPEIVDDALAYISVAAFTMALSGFINAANAVLRGYGHTIELMLISGLGIALYHPLQYAMIYGQWGLPEMGVWGAALSTLVMRSLGVAALIGVMAWRLDFSWRIRYGWRHVNQLVLRLFKLSYPSVGTDLAFNLYQLTILPVIAVLGVGAIQARDYLFQITMLLTVIGIVISSGNEVLIGYDRGHNDNRQARRRAFRTAVGVAVVTTAMTLPLYLYVETIMSLFVDDTEAYADVIAEIKKLMLIYIFFQPLQSIAYMLFNSLKAVGDVLVPAIYSLAGTWVIGVPLTYLFVKYWGFGVPGLMYALLATEGFKASVMTVRWSRMRWVRFNVIEQPSTPDNENAPTTKSPPELSA